MGFVVRIIENNEFLHSKKGKVSKWSTTEINYNGGKILAKGVGSEVRGGTYDYIVCDDILRSDNKLSDEDISTFIGEELEAMIFVRRGQIVIVGTPKSESDIFSEIEEKIDLKGDDSGWKLFSYPAILDWNLTLHQHIYLYIRRKRKNEHITMLSNAGQSKRNIFTRYTY